MSFGNSIFTPGANWAGPTTTVDTSKLPAGPGAAPGVVSRDESVGPALRKSGASAKIHGRRSDPTTDRNLAVRANRHRAHARGCRGSENARPQDSPITRLRRDESPASSTGEGLFAELEPTDELAAHRDDPWRGCSRSNDRYRFIGAFRGHGCREKEQRRQAAGAAVEHFMELNPRSPVATWLPRIRRQRGSARNQTELERDMTRGKVCRRRHALAFR